MKKKIRELTKEEYSQYRKAISHRYYECHKQEIQEKIKSKYWKKPCPICSRDIRYTNQSNLNKSIALNLSCRRCSQRLRPFEYLYNSLRYKSKTRSIPFSLTFEEFMEFTKIPTCHYCECKIEWVEHNTNKSIRGYRYNLDRMDNDRGYTAPNCCVCCPTCNGVKSNVFSYKEMVELGKTIRQLRHVST
jgi:hypothetical protein